MPAKPIKFAACATRPDPTAAPPGTSPVATGHTHGLQDELNNSEVLSNEDMRVAYQMWIDTGGDVGILFIATVSGRVIAYDPSFYVLGPGPGYACQTAGASVIQGPSTPSPYPPCYH